MNTETILAIGTAVLVPSLIAYLKYRTDAKKAHAELLAAGGRAGAETAKGQYEIWREEWGKIVGSLEARIKDAEEATEETRNELRELQKENADLAAELAMCKRLMRKAGILNENGPPQ